VGEVEPHHVDRAVVGEQLAYLTVEVIPVDGDVPPLRRRLERLVVALGVDGVDGVLRVMPVDHGVVEPDLQPLSTKRLDPFPEQVAPDRSIGRLVVRQLRVPQAEAFVVLTGQDCVAHPGRLGVACPLRGVVEVGVEVIEVGLIRLVGEALAKLDPLVTGRQRVESPVDEQAETCLCEPVRGCLTPAIVAHRQNNLLAVV
jgi:hypothetical protein